MQMLSSKDPLWARHKGGWMGRTVCDLEVGKQSLHSGDWLSHPHPHPVHGLRGCPCVRARCTRKLWCDEGDEGGAQNDDLGVAVGIESERPCDVVQLACVLALLWLPKASHTGKCCGEFPTRKSQESLQTE